MRFLLPAHQIRPSIALLNDMPLTGGASRARSKLVRLLEQAYASFAEDEYELVRAHAVCDEDGQPVIDDDGTVTLADPDHATGFHAQHQALLSQRVEVEGPTYEHHGHDVVSILDAALEMELSGSAAAAYDALYDAITESLAGGEQHP